MVKDIIDPQHSGRSSAGNTRSSVLVGIPLSFHHECRRQRRWVGFDVIPRVGVVGAFGTYFTRTRLLCVVCSPSVRRVGGVVSYALRM